MPSAIYLLPAVAAASQLASQVVHAGTQFEADRTWTLASLAAFLAGVALHWFYFRVGEHHLYGTRYIFAALSLLPAGTIGLAKLAECSWSQSASWTILLLSSALAGTYSSLVVFRLFLHPLKRFGGPIGCRVSSAWFATYLAKSDAFRQLAALHDKHGEFLRIGSNDLSIAHPAAVQAIYGLGTRCRKAPWYDLTYPVVSLQSTRVKSDHDQRRRVWSSAFGDKNLRDYEIRMASYRALLIKAIDQAGSRSIDMSKWFNLYTFDVMGDLAFGSSFRMLETSREHEAIRLLNKGLQPLAYMLPMWIFRIIVAIPGATREWWQFMSYCGDQLAQRIEAKVLVPDIMSTLLKPMQGKKPNKKELEWLQGDSQLIVVAGSDTTSATLTNILSELMRHPQHMSLLRKELVGIPRTEHGDFRHADVSALPHLNGVINEALRLWPPVPSALQRLTPPEGLLIGETHVPGNVTVYCPQYVVGRNPKCYKNPNEFIPERWYSRADLIVDDRGFAPFSAGSYGCIGKPLALLNIRTTLCRLMADYDVQLAPGVSLDEFDALRTEHFTMAVPPLKLTFAKRSSLV